MNSRIILLILDLKFFEMLLYKMILTQTKDLEMVPYKNLTKRTRKKSKSE